MALLLSLTVTPTARQTWEIIALAHAFLEEMHFPEELIVNTSLEKAAAYIPKLKQLLSENEAFRASAERNTAL